MIAAGAGMGVDSGLPDFRGNEGFWNAYPPYRNLGVSFVEMANPAHFAGDPAFGWGFYGHRTQLYRDTVPHKGFGILKRWIGELQLDAFVVTSNVDGQFQKAGFSEASICEVHGSIHHLQCSHPCSEAIWPNREKVRVDPETMRAAHLPTCPSCGAVARPNILMFGDAGWNPDRTHQQEVRLDAFLRAQQGQSLLIIELGAGTGVPTIRNLSERLMRRDSAHLLRLNPREPRAPAGALSLATGALAGLQQVDAALSAAG